MLCDSDPGCNKSNKWWRPRHQEMERFTWLGQHLSWCDAGSDITYTQSTRASQNKTYLRRVFLHSLCHDRLSLHVTTPKPKHVHNHQTCLIVWTFPFIYICLLSTIQVRQMEMKWMVLGISYFMRQKWLRSTLYSWQRSESGWSASNFNVAINWCGVWHSQVWGYRSLGNRLWHVSLTNNIKQLNNCKQPYLRLGLTYEWQMDGQTHRQWLLYNKRYHLLAAVPGGRLNLRVPPCVSEVGGWCWPQYLLKIRK